MNNTLYDIRCKFVELMNNEELTEEQVVNKKIELNIESTNENV